MKLAKVLHESVYRLDMAHFVFFMQIPVRILIRLKTFQGLDQGSKIRVIRVLGIRTLFPVCVFLEQGPGAVALTVMQRYVLFEHFLFHVDGSGIEGTKV